MEDKKRKMERLRKQSHYVYGASAISLKDEPLTKRKAQILPN